MTNTEPQEMEKKPPATLGRKLSRRLSIMAKVPSIINAKFKQDLVNSNSNGPEFLSEIKSFDLIIIAPDKTQRILPCTRGQHIVEVITPILEEFSISSPKLYLGGSQAIVQPEADCIYLYENVLIVEHKEPTTQVDGITMNFYKLIEKIMNEESEYVKVLSSAAELYDNPTSTDNNSICELSVVFQSLNNLGVVCSGVVNELTSALFMENCWSLDIRCIFNDKVWEEYDNYLQNYRIFKRIIRQKKSEDENFVHICRLRQGAAKYSLEEIIDFPFITYVECAFQTWKPILEIPFHFHAPQKIFLDTINISSMPEDIVNLNAKCDKWMDNYDPKSFPLPLKTTTTIESTGTHLSAKPAERDTDFFYKDCRSDLETDYKKWYYFLTENDSDIAKQLKEELSNHAKHYHDFYKDQSITVRFAACIARSYILCCTMHHRVLPDLRIYLKAHPKADFVKRLFEVIPSWYLDEETLLYFNILRPIIKYELFDERINGDILCLPARNPENKLTCIPYLHSEECSNVDFAKHLTLESRLIRLTPTTPLPLPLNRK